jgi:hypothetical protein
MDWLVGWVGLLLWGLTVAGIVGEFAVRGDPFRLLFLGFVALLVFWGGILSVSLLVES